VRRWACLFPFTKESQIKTILNAAIGAALAFFLVGGVVAAESPEKAVSDSWITTKVKSELAADKEVSSTHIHVKTVDGVVTLTGTTKSKGSIDRAVEDANKVKGVKSVVNNLEVKS
jgi:hyperosmotically inducible protein